MNIFVIIYSNWFQASNCPQKHNYILMENIYKKCKLTTIEVINLTTFSRSLSSTLKIQLLWLHRGKYSSSNLLQDLWKWLIERSRKSLKRQKRKNPRKNQFQKKLQLKKERRKLCSLKKILMSGMLKIGVVMPKKLWRLKRIWKNVS